MKVKSGGQIYMSPSEIPSVCSGCKFHDWDSKDEYSPNWSYCLKGRFFPTKRNNCNLMEPCKTKNKWEMK